jgi:hypothetical protein
MPIYSTPDFENINGVNAPTPADGDVLTYDDANSEWVAAAPATPVADLDDLQDVDAPTPNGGDVLTYDTLTTSWVPAAASGGGTPLAAGLWYGPQAYSDIAPNSLVASQSTLNSVANFNRIWFMPFYVSAESTIDYMAQVVGTSQAGLTSRLGIYSGDLPTTLVLDAGTIDCSGSSGTRELSITPLTLSPGWYWLASCLQGSTGSGATQRVSLTVFSPVAYKNANDALGGTTGRGWGYATTTAATSGALPASIASADIQSVSIITPIAVRGA